VTILSHVNERASYGRRHNLRRPPCPALQVLPKTLGIALDIVIVLDALRKQRNLNDYEGDPVSDTAVEECLKQAGDLLSHTREWLRANRPDLLGETR